MIDSTILFNTSLAVLAVAWVIIGYITMGGRRLWGKRRGEPFCVHPFEQTWGMNPKPMRWTCPNCGTRFVLIHSRWQMVERGPRLFSARSKRKKANAE